MRTVKALVANARARAARIEDYAYLRVWGLTPEQAAERLGLNPETGMDHLEPFRGDVPPWPPREHPPANPGRHCGSRFGYALHEVWQESPCPACLLARYPGLMSEDIAARPTPLPPRPLPAVEPPPPVPADVAARHLADLAGEVGAPIPWGEITGPVRMAVAATDGVAA